MINNKKLIFLAVSLIPIVVISFIYKNKTNFILEDDKDIYIKVKYKDDILKLELENYIEGVVAGEMPALFNIEALKAQAVASRTYALYKKQAKNSIYDLTSDTSNQVYLSDLDLKEKWGKDYQTYKEKIKSAVEQTKGEIMLYDGTLIDALYFSMSAGTTQDVKSVFKEDLSYLKSTESIYDNNSLKGFEVTKTISKSEFISSLGLECKDPYIDEILYNESGYVDKITICDKTYDGNNFRKKLNLRSANFKIDISDNIKITTYGYGHGVGMSQYGANGYANAGLNYIDILKHYYDGIEIKNIKDV